MTAGTEVLTPLLAPVKALAAAVQPIRIKNVETFNIEIPATATEIEAGVANRIPAARGGGGSPVVRRSRRGQGRVVDASLRA